MTTRRATLALGLLLVALVVVFAIPGTGMFDTNKHRVLRTFLSHIAVLTLMWAAVPALGRVIARLDGVPTPTLTVALGVVIVVPVVALGALQLAVPGATKHLVSREWGVVEPLQVAFYATALWLCLAVRRHLARDDRARLLYRGGAIVTAIMIAEEVDYLSVLNLFARAAGAPGGRLGRKHIGAIHDVIDAWTQQIGLGAVAAVIAAGVAAAFLLLWAVFSAWRPTIRREAARPGVALLGVFVAALVTAQVIDIEDETLTGGAPIGMIEEPLELAGALALNAALILRLRQARCEQRYENIPPPRCEPRRQ
jgi:hypothetical protein